MIHGLVVNLRQLQEFHHINTAVAALAFGEEVGRSTHHCRNLMLGEPNLLSCRNQALQKGIVDPLKLGSSRLS